MAIERIMDIVKDILFVLSPIFDIGNHFGSGYDRQSNLWYG